MLHLTTGDVNAARLREAELPGAVVAYVDALHEGPVPAGVTGDAWLSLRARFVAEQGWTTYEQARARLAEGEQAVDRARDHKEIVVRVEHDPLRRVEGQRAGGSSPPPRRGKRHRS